MADENKVLGIRLDAEERKRFDEFVSQEGKNNKEFIGTLLNLYELNKGKVKNINLVGDIEVLESYTSKIQQTFINIIEKLESQKGDIIEDSNKDLSIYKDKVNELQNKLDTLKASNTTNSEELTRVNSVMLTLEEKNKALNESLKDRTELVENYKGKNDMLLTDLAEHKQYKVRNEELSKLLADSQSRNIDKDNSIKEKEFSISGLNTSLQNKDEAIAELKIKSDLDIDKMKQESKKELAQLQKENELNIKLAVADVREELNKKIQEEQAKSNEAIQEYQNKYKDLLEQLEKARQTTKKSTPVNDGVSKNK
jgi:chromosome segregation ATPase